MKKYKFVDVVSADIAFEAYGKDLDEFFANSAEAVFETMADLKTVKPKTSKTVELENGKIEFLLHDFLEKIVFFKDAESLLFSSADVSIEKDKNYKLKAELKGEKIDIKKHKLGYDVKAVTLHKFRVEQTAEGWECFVILDI